VPTSERENAHAIAAPLMPALGAAFAILTALTLANEAGYLTSAQQIVGTEVADASRLAWASTVPGVHGAPIQTALRQYLHATRKYEWHGPNAASGDDTHTDRALAKLEHIVRVQAVRPQLGTPTSTELLAALDALAACVVSTRPGNGRPAPCQSTLSPAEAVDALGPGRRSSEPAVTTCDAEGRRRHTHGFSCSHAA
jgi:hypothetical protein